VFCSYPECSHKVIELASQRTLAVGGKGAYRLAVAGFDYVEEHLDNVDSL
jgi:hypothetical protein